MTFEVFRLCAPLSKPKKKPTKHALHTCEKKHTLSDMSEEDVDPSTVAPAAADAEFIRARRRRRLERRRPSPSLAAQVPENEPAAADADAEPLPDAEAATDIVEPSPAAQMAVEENEGVSTTLPPATAAPPAAEVAAQETSDSTEPESAAPESAQDGLQPAQAALDQPPGGTAVAGQAKTLTLPNSPRQVLSLQPARGWRCSRCEGRVV